MKNYQISFLTLIILLFQYSIGGSKLIQIPIYYDYFNNYIAIYAGNPLRKFDLFLDFRANYSWVSNLLYQSQSKIINSYSSLIIDEKEYNATEIQDSVFLEEINETNYNTIKEFHFYLINNTTLYSTQYSHGKLAIGYKFIDSKYSLIHQYYNKGFIDHLSFSISKEKDKFTLGGISSEQTIGRTYSYCNVIANKKEWNCLIGNVTFMHNNKLEVFNNKVENNYAIFTNEIQHHFAPKGFLNMVINSFFKNEIERQSCFLRTYNHYNYLYCATSREIKEGNITFDIGDYSHTIPLKYFWFCPEYSCFFKFRDNENGDYWIIGSDFYKKKTIHFDYEQSKIHFYSLEGVTKQKHIDKKAESKEIKPEGNVLQNIPLHIRKICTVNIFIVLFGIIILINIKRISKY